MRLVRHGERIEWRSGKPFFLVQTLSTNAVRPSTLAHAVGRTPDGCARDYSGLADRAQRKPMTFTRWSGGERPRTIDRRLAGLCVAQPPPRTTRGESGPGLSGVAVHSHKFPAMS